MIQKKAWKKSGFQLGFVGVYTVFLGLSFLFGFDPGKQIARNFFDFAQTMLRMLPFAFLLIGLFEVWVERERVEKHLGRESGIKGYMWGIILAGAVVGPLYVALPIAYALFKKGARLGVIFTYIGASAICRVPMMTFEATFLGVKFTLVRLLVSLPLVVTTSMLLEKYLMKSSYRITEKH